jgi:endonuclease/exonuclease/phosphatase (EEP) superfamily protein YafD
MVRKGIKILYTGSCIVTLCLFASIYTSFYTELDWSLDLATSFAPQIFVLSILLAAINIARKEKALANASVAICALYLVFLVQTIYTNNDKAGAEADLSFLSHNLFNKNTQYGATEELILNADADIVLLTEFLTSWNANLAKLSTQYPYSAKLPDEKGYGIALFSKHLIQSYRMEKFAGVEFPCIVCKVQFQGQFINVIGVHLNPPLNPCAHTQRGLQIEAITKEINQSAKEPYVLIGDFNATPYCPDYRNLQKNTPLRGTAFTATLKNTWHPNRPILGPLLGTNVDHIFLSPHFTPVTRKILPKTGSDHNPVYLEASFKPKLEEG